MIERTVSVRTHGRYLISVPPGAGPWPLLVGFHGYAEHAGIALERQEALDPRGCWLRVAVQGLNRFYRGRSSDVIAGWMTRQDRELAIADNVAYVTAVVDAVAEEWPVAGPVVLCGFSQGVAMAFRAAVASPRTVAAVVSLGGDIPPELDRAALGRIARVLLGRGSGDGWYTHEKFQADERRLRDAGVAVDAVPVEGGHEWNEEFASAAREFLEAVLQP